MGRALSIDLILVTLTAGLASACHASPVDTVATTTAALTAADCPPGYNVIVGTAGDDVLEGTSGNDCILGLSGDDVINGGNGNDFISGDAGNDSLSGDNGSDTVDGGEGDDVISGGNGQDELAGGTGNDIIDAGNGADAVDAGLGNDVVMPSNGRDSGTGGPGQDACSLADCESAVPQSCDDASDCPDPASQTCTGGACIYCLSDSSCSDGSKCTGVETCRPHTGCVDGEALAYGTVDIPDDCAVGVGVCYRRGDVICDGAGGTLCSATAGEPSGDDTDCNGDDDDCDGFRDEGYVQPSTMCGEGPCRAEGVLRCVLGVQVDTCTPLPVALDEVCDGQDNDCDGTVDEGEWPDSDEDGLCDASDDCPFHPRPTSDGDVIVGTVVCSAPYLSGTLAPVGLQSLPVRVASFAETTTDCLGRFTLPVPEGTTLSAGMHAVAFYFDGHVPGPGGISTWLRVTDERDNSWGTDLFHTGYARNVLGTLSTAAEGHQVLSLAPVEIESSECEIWHLATEIVSDFQQLKLEATPGGVLKILRQPVIEVHGPYTPYDMIDLPANILDGRPTRPSLRRTLYHEAGHVFRDVYDGNLGHWAGDLFNYAYAQCHTGRDIFSEPYAFHEGFASYWARARGASHGRIPMGSPAVTEYCDGTIGPGGLPLDDRYTDWVEDMIGNRLLDLAVCLGGTSPDQGDVILLETLEANPQTIHSLYQFESALCRAGYGCDTCRPEPPDPCPPGYENLGEFCQGYGQSFRRFP